MTFFLLHVGKKPLKNGRLDGDHPHLGPKKLSNAGKDPDILDFSERPKDGRK
jgi:hypothetical protein